MPDLILSIVTGTYQRLPSLQAMIESVRAQIPRHIGHEFIVVDAGSEDATPAWCQAQPDIRYLDHGELRGAIRAFCDGARIARGEYVILANDDVIFWPYSVMRALAYLEDHRGCGAVAFADDRASQMDDRWQGHNVLQMPAIGPDGVRSGVLYAQVGMFRRWLGDHAGWWGDQDPIMGQARTYGGDNYLSARLWELGYSVDAVEGCAVDDGIVRDALREGNSSSGNQDSRQYYARYPQGPSIASFPSLPNPQPERLRTVVMDIHEPSLPARTAREQGLAEAMAAAALTWHVDYVNEKWDLPAIVRAWQPHLLLTQMHDTSRINAEVLRAARTECPDMVIVNWNGDAHEKGLISPDILEALQEVDLQTVVNAKVLPVYQGYGIPAAYWQIGYKDPGSPYEGSVPEWDVLFLGNCYNETRQVLVRTLQALPYRVGIYGSCEGSQGNTHYDFAFSRALYEHAVMAISDTYPGTEGFVSNRLFQALSGGAFVLQERSERLDELTGLRADVHYVEWRDMDDLTAQIHTWMQPERAEERAAIAEAGMRFVRENFSYPAQIRKLWELLPE